MVDCMLTPAVRDEDVCGKCDACGWNRPVHEERIKELHEVAGRGQLGSWGAPKPTVGSTSAIRLRLGRIAMNKTQAEVGECVGLSGATISRYEMGTDLPEPGTVARLARLMGVSEAWLRGYGSTFGEGEEACTSIQSPSEHS